MGVLGKLTQNALSTLAENTGQRPDICLINMEISPLTPMHKVSHNDYYVKLIIDVYKVE
ncbi:hypothetical protein GCM10009426_11300 [Rheinheimera tangshanensis]|nr:hypothetical protein GCM10010920_25900 [Rheinheimera tangshanensis]